MNLNFREFLSQAEKTEEAALLRSPIFKDVAVEDRAKRAQDFNESVDVIKSLMTQHVSRVPQTYGLKTGGGQELFQGRERGELPLFSFKESLLSNDASVLFTRAISDVLMQPEETVYIGQDILAQKVTVDAVRSVTFPTMGGIVAGVVAENGTYPERSPNFNMQQIELRVKKYGLQISIGDDVIEDSMWDIFGLMVSAGKSAMRRYKEELIFNEAMQKAHVVFDNASGNPLLYTTGLSAGSVSVPGVANGTIQMNDILDMAGAIMGEGYNPDYLAVHPLAWVSLAKDPRLQFSALMNGSYNQSMPTPGIDSAAIKGYLPFGMLNIVVSPQLPFTFHQPITMNSILLPQTNLTSMLMLEKQRSLVVLQRDELHLEEFNHPERDIKMLRMGERYVVGSLDGARSMAIAKNIRLGVVNHAPVFNLGQSAPA